MGRHDLAQSHAEGLVEQQKFCPAAAIYASLGKTDRAFQLLDQGLESSDDMIMSLPTEPTFAPLRSAPRFD